MTKEKVSLKLFEKSVLPALQEEHKDIAALQKAIDDGYDIYETDAKGAETLVKFSVSAGGKSPEQAVADTTNVDGKAVAKLVADAVDSVLKSDREARAKNPLVGKDGKPTITTHDNADDDPKFGFKSIGEQAHIIKAWYTGDDAAKKDERIQRIMTKAPSTYANEGTGADGGFLLAPEFSNKVLSHTFNDESLFSRTDTYTSGSNNLTIPKDETTPWGTNGVQVYWTAEAGQVTQSKLKLGQDNLQLNKLTALVPVTDEQLQDSFVGLGEYISRQAGERIRWAVDDSLVNGTGAGKPLGFFNSGSLVSVAKVTGQTAATINITNIASMLSVIPNLDTANCAWLVHPAAFPQLVILTNGNQSLYIAAGGVGNANPRLGTLFGIPVIISQHCPATLGTQGDIFLVDLKKYLTLTKGDGIQTAMSMHLFFDYNVSAFRFNFRVAGQPWLSTSITSAYGSFTQSPFVTLDTRS